MPDLKVALFVEGSNVPLPRHRQQPLDAIWNGCFGEALDLHRFDPIVPISKTHLVAMDPDNPPMSGAGEALDVLITRMLRLHSFEVAVVAWDLVPAWNPAGEFCRWEETLKLYRYLAQSTGAFRIGPVRDGAIFAKDDRTRTFFLRPSEPSPDSGRSSRHTESLEET